jgi:hypothetical protein
MFLSLKRNRNPLIRVLNHLTCLHRNPSPEQRQFLEDIRGLGGLAIVARSYRDIEAALRESGYTGIMADVLNYVADNPEILSKVH